MQIVQYPHPALRWKSRPITEINAELRTIVRSMFDLMYESQGIGLAANQVDLPFRVFVLNLTGDREEKKEEHVFINPTITQRRGTQESEEGCLSLPKLYAEVRRAQEITVEAFDLEGRGFEVTVDDLASRAIQHETDHLDGVLFIDRLSDSGKREIATTLTDFENQFRRQQQLGTFPSDEQIREELRRQEASGPQQPEGVASQT